MCGKQHDAGWTFWFSTVKDPGRDYPKRSENHTVRVQWKGLLNKSARSRFSKNPQESPLERSQGKTNETELEGTIPPDPGAGRAGNAGTEGYWAAGGALPRTAPGSGRW